VTAFLLPTLIAGLLTLAFIVVVRPDRAGVQIVVAFALLGLAGYGWQAQTELPGRPASTDANRAIRPSLFADERSVWFETVGPNAQLLDAADTFIRSGNPDYAAGFLRGELSRRPGVAVLWVGYGNALMAYADGNLTPAARLAFERAVALSPTHPGPAYFLAAAEAGAGNLDTADAIWTSLARRPSLPPEWRELIQDKRAIVAGLRARSVGTP
jgi:cytochrome c-type biogenesis protein CcmH